MELSLPPRRRWSRMILIAPGLGTPGVKTGKQSAVRCTQLTNDTLNNTSRKFVLQEDIASLCGCFTNIRDVMLFNFLD